MKEYPVKREKIVYLSNEDMLKEVSKWYKPKWMAQFIGGYCTPTDMTIYIKESRKGDIKLLNHERGHLKGYKHTCYPTLMFASWVGRWLNKYWPPYGKIDKYESGESQILAFAP